MPLAIFDLDNTLLDGDSDYLWGVFLSAKGIVDRDYYERENQKFYDDYKAGTLDIYAFLRFSLRPLKDNSLASLEAWREEFLRQCIDPIILPAGRALIEKHRAAGDTLLIITATNAFVTTPIAARLGVENLIATDPEMVDGRYTGEVAGEPSYKEGKVTRLNRWLQAHGQDMAGSSFYSDSHNDIPLLERVAYPTAVDPDPQLLSRAQDSGWPIISLKQQDPVAGR